MQMLKNINLVPEWITHYQKDWFKGDLFAGITIGIMLIPQGMAYAMIAGVPPIYGLYSSLFPPLVYAFTGSSRQLSVAPVAMVSLLIFAGVTALNPASPAEYLSLTLTLTLLVGLVQFLLGLVRLGFVVNFLSMPVISGYTSAASLVIALSQLKHLLGADIASGNLLPQIIENTIEKIGHTNHVTVAIGLLAMLTLYLIKKYIPKIPGQIVVVIGGIVAVYALQLYDSGVKIIGEVPAGLPAFTLPVLGYERLVTLLPLAMLISLVGFMESYSVARSIQSKHKNYTLSANKELIALGLSNMTGSLFTSFAASGGFSRSAVNDQAGAKTPLAVILGAIIVALTLLFLTPLFYYLPKAILAAIILMAVLNLIDLGIMKYLWKTNKKDLAMLLATMLATLFFGVQIGISTGLILSLVLVIRGSAYPHFAELGRLPGINYYRNVNRFPEAESRPDLLIIRFDAPLYFANIGYFIDKVKELLQKKGPQVKAIIINAQAINSLDSSAVSGLQDLFVDLSKGNIAIYFTEVIGPVRDMMLRTGLSEHIGADHFHPRIQDAVDHFDEDKKKGL